MRWKRDRILAAALASAWLGLCAPGAAQPSYSAALAEQLAGQPRTAPERSVQEILGGRSHAALGSLTLDFARFVHRYESFCYDDLVCEAEMDFSQLGEAEQASLRADWPAFQEQCRLLSEGEPARGEDAWARLARLSQARERRMALPEAQKQRFDGKLTSKCIAEADVAAAREISALPDAEIGRMVRAADEAQMQTLFLIAQHADRLPLLQIRLAQLFGAERCADFSLTVQQRCAYLVDRVLVRFGQPQLFGTQFDCQLFARQDLAEIESRRAQLDLGSLAEYQRCAR